MTNANGPLMISHETIREDDGSLLVELNVYSDGTIRMWTLDSDDPVDMDFPGWIKLQTYLAHAMAQAHARLVLEQDGR